MPEDTSEIPQSTTDLGLGKTLNTEEIRGITYERIPFPANGRFVKAFLDAHPEVEVSRDLWPDLMEANSGQSEITMLFPGYKEAHTKSIMRGRTVHNLVERLGDTVGFVDWMNTTHIEELIARGLADHFEARGYEGIKMFGASHGGYFALKLANYFEKFKDEGFDIPVESVVIAVAPTSRDCFKTKIPLDPDLAIGAGHMVLDGFLSKTIGLRIPVPEFARRPRSDLVRLLAVTKEPFKQGDFPDGMVVHYFATDARAGNTDRLVNQPLAISQLRNAGLTVEVHEYKPGALGHVIHSDDIARMNEDMLNIFSSSDKDRPSST